MGPPLHSIGIENYIFVLGGAIQKYVNVNSDFILAETMSLLAGPAPLVNNLFYLYHNEYNFTIMSWIGL